MKKMCSIFNVVMMFCLLAILTACSGGGGGGTPAPVAKTLTGTAAAGAPIIGSVTIKDSLGVQKTVQIEANGKYTVDVSDLTAPYMVRADGYVGGNEYHLFSAGTAADVGGTINITPLTDLIVANIAKTVASDYFNSNFSTTLTADALKTQSDALASKLQPILQAAGVTGAIDLLRASFNTDHTGLDAALDILKVETNATTNVATITNIITQQQMTSNIATASYTGVLDNTTGVATGITDIQAISAGFKKFSDLFATSLPTETNATLLGLFDSATFMQEGQSLAAFLPQITTDKSMIGISFTNITIQSMDVAKGTAVVGFTVLQGGKVSNDAPDSWNMIKKDGKWYMQGDLRIANVKVKSRAEYRPSDVSQTKIVTGLDLNIEDRGGKGIARAVVTGKGLTGSVTLINQINQDWFTIQTTNNNNSGSLYVMNDTQISAIADTGELYTIKLYDANNVLKATYTEKLRKRPAKNSELDATKFPAITKPTVTELRALNGTSATINGTINWTLPTGLTNDWLQIQIGDNSGNTARAEFSLLATETSKNFTLIPVTSTGQSFTITNGFIWLSAWDSFGRQLAVSLW